MRTPRVLVIEDNALNMELVCDLLTAEGFEVLSAYTAEDGLRLALEKQPDLVVMDLSLPGMDGLEATRRLRRDPATKKLPVVALTAHAMKGDDEMVFLAGCDAYLTKPINTRQLGSTLRKFIGPVAGCEVLNNAMNSVSHAAVD